MPLTFVVLVSYLLLLSTTSLGKLPAPEGLSAENVTHNGFIVSFYPVSDAIEYEINVTSLHDPLDSIQVTTTYNVVEFRNRGSNINYMIRVRAKDQDGFYGICAYLLNRTGPNGANVVQAITAPTFLTLFFEEIPGALGWEVEIVNSITEVSRVIRVPDEVPSRTQYVAVITHLNPNTFYDVRVRVSEVASEPRKLSVNRSPFGAFRKVSTERLSAFGRVELLTFSYTKNWSSNSSLIKLIEYQLREAYQKVATNAFWVTVIQLLDSGNGNILCHHEILLNDHTADPFIGNLTLSDAAKYHNGKVRFGVSSNPGYSYTAFDELMYKDSGRCVGKAFHSEIDVLKWKAYSKSDRQFINIPKPTTRLGFPVKVTFVRNTVQVEGSIAMTLKSNTIFGMKHNYLIANCPSNEKDTIYFDRIYKTKSESANDLARDYTVFYATGMDRVHKSRIFARINDEKKITSLTIPSSLFSRLVLCEFLLHNQLIAILPEENIDSSNKYQVRLPNVRFGDVIEVRAYSRNHYGLKTLTKFTVRMREGALIDDSNRNENLRDRNQDLNEGRMSNEGTLPESMLWLAGPIIAYFCLIVFTAAVGCYLGRKFYANQSRFGAREKKKRTKKKIVENKTKMPETKSPKLFSKKEDNKEKIQSLHDVIDEMPSIQNDITDTEVQEIFANGDLVSDMILDDVAGNDV